MIDFINCTADATTLAHARTLGFAKVLTRQDVRVADGGSDLDNRKFIEGKQIAVLMNPERKQFRDKTHSRNSGLNHIMATLARKNDVAIGFGFHALLHASPVERAGILGRMQQNVRLCRKAKTAMIICSNAHNHTELRGAKDLQAFARVLGMTGNEAKQALHWKARTKKVRISR